MRILVLGGTAFIGRHITAALLGRGHGVTLFHRGLADPNAFPNVEHILGDRAGDLTGLRGRRWDVVIDTNGYEVKSVREPVHCLAHPELLYVFVSSISVYREFGRTAEAAEVQS